MQRMYLVICDNKNTASWWIHSAWHDKDNAEACLERLQFNNPRFGQELWTLYGRVICQEVWDV